MRKMMGRKGRVLALVAIALAVVGTYGVQATHNFPDVPTGSFYHASVEWIVNRGVTGGCGGGLYCPTSNVTRAEMAVFMRNLGLAMTPRVIVTDSGGGSFDLDIQQNQCQTPSYTALFSQQALVCVQSSVRAPAGAALQLALFPTVSTDGGATFNFVGSGNFDRNHANLNEWTSTTRCSNMDLTAGTSYIFASRPMREAGTGDPSDSRCKTVVEIFNRNPASSPLIRQEGIAFDTDGAQ